MEQINPLGVPIGHFIYSKTLTTVWDVFGEKKVIVNCGMRQYLS